MSIIKNPLKHEDNKESLGLTAIGSAGGWEVAIDETTSGSTQKWFAQIEGHSVYLYFAVDSPRVIDKMLDFLSEPMPDEKGSQGSTAQRNGEIAIGNSKEEPVILVRDDEFSDRYFLIMQTIKKMVVRVTLGGTHLNSLVIALRQAKADLDEADAD